jgi:hypothetical protein
MKAATQTYYIYSGEGTGEGHKKTVATTLRGLKMRLTRERCGGDRWAFATDTDGSRIKI